MAALRLFVAIYPPESARRAMLDALAALSTPDRHRITPLAQLHMTVQFIGEVSPRGLDEVTESVQRSAAGISAFDLKPRRLITLPKRGRPRLIALETDAPPALLELHRRLAMRLAKSPRAKAADRFLPHITLCRFDGAASASPVDLPVNLDAFPISSIFLMRSILRPQGAEHVAILEAPLLPAKRQ